MRGFKQGKTMKDREEKIFNSSKDYHSAKRQLNLLNAWLFRARNLAQSLGIDDMERLFYSFDQEVKELNERINQFEAFRQYSTVCDLNRRKKLVERFQVCRVHRRIIY